MSNFRGGSGPELFYSYSVAGTALNTFTTEASLMGLYPFCAIPATWFDKAASLESSSMKVRAGITLGDTSTAPTFAAGIRLTTTQTFASTLGWLSTTVTPNVTSQATIHAQLDADITLRTLSASASASTVSCVGTWSMPSAANGTIPASGTSDTITTLDTSGGTSLYYLWISAACGTSNAANTAQLVQLKVYLEN